MSSPGWADSCSTVSLTVNGAPITCTVPEQTPELAATATLTGLSFTDQAGGMVLIYDDSTHTLLSDVVTFTNVNGVATVTLFSDTDGIPVTAQGLPILGQFTESNNPISISVALGTGNFLNAKICSGIRENRIYSCTSCWLVLPQGRTAVPAPGTCL